MEKISDFLVGTDVFHLMSGAMTPPAVSILETKSANSENNVKEMKRTQEIRSLLRSIASEDGGLDGGTVGDDLAGVDRLVGLLAVGEVGHELDDAGDTGGATDEDDLDLSIFESRSTFSTGSRVLRKRSWHSSSKRARVREV